MNLFARIISVFVVLLLFCPALMAGQPRLVLLIAVDQLRPDRLDAAMPGGLGRLMRQGHVFTRATLDHGLTSTCPGHVAISTGVNPGKAGIPGNGYIDHDTMAERYCVDDADDAHTVIGGADNRSPNALTATTLGDWLKAKSPDSKVFSVAGKDRAAITLGGRRADGAFWYDADLAGFTSSRYYADRLPGYVAEFNGDNFFEDGYGGGFPPAWHHPAGTRRADDYPGESGAHSRKSAHPLNTGEVSDRANRLYASAFLDMATAELARRVIAQEQLGQDDVTDLLALSFSATDVVGHFYGPFSAESEDTLARLDAELGLLLDMLDETLAGNYLLALSADHGVMPLPEWLAETGALKCPVAGGRVDVREGILSLYWHLYREFTFPFGWPADLVRYSPAGLTVNAGYARRLGVSPAAVVAWLEDYYERKPEIAAAWTGEELAQSRDPFARLYRNSFVPGKSAHVILQFRETCLAFRPEGTSHGSPYLYDRRVPLIFFGAGVRRFTSAEERHSIDIAPTLGARMKLGLPANLDGRVLDIWEAD